MGPSSKRERAYDRTLAAWAKQWRDTYLSPSITIQQAALIAVRWHAAQAARYIGRTAWTNPQHLSAAKRLYEAT